MNVLTVSATPTVSIEALARDFALRLQTLVEGAAHERGLELIETLFARLRSGASLGLGKRAAGRAERARRRVVGALARQLVRSLEQSIRARVREGLAEARAEARRAARPKGPRPPSAPRRRQPRRPPPPPPPDPEQLKRDAELARLRALLRPTSEDLPAIPEPAAPPPPPPPAPTTPGELLRALEKEIQDTVPALSALPPDRAGAQIAAWAGQVRELREQLPSELAALMRPAIRIFLEHLTDLRSALDAAFVDALEPRWRPPDWGAYIEAHRARAEGRAPALDTERLVAHHRAMLKALVQPHRRNVPAQAEPVIAAAAEVLPATDGQLRSAIRRHRGSAARPEPVADTGSADETLPLPEGPETEPPAPLEAPPPEDTPAAETASGESALAPEAPAADAGLGETPPADDADEFDRLWTK